MKFTFMSDVHIDATLWNWDIIMAAVEHTDTLVVAGDISNDVCYTCDWLVEARKRFKNVIWIAGNHDFYNQGLHKTRLIPNREFALKWPAPRTVTEIYDHYHRWSLEHDIHFLNRTSVIINDVTFVGVTGWHDYMAGDPFTREEQIKAWYQALNDKIIVWDTNDTKPNHIHALHAAHADAQWLKSTAPKLTGPTVVISHHIPHRLLKWEMPHDLIWTKLHGCFVNTMMEDITSTHIVYWCYGHTHQRKMKKIHNCDFVCNARGYTHEIKNWQPLVLKV